MPREGGGIQYSSGVEIHHKRRGVLDRPVEPGDDTFVW
jgi:hypothetical protein